MVSKKNMKGRFSDRKSKSKESHEKRGKRKGNPRYTPVMVTDKKGNRKKVYKTRKR